MFSGQMALTTLVHSFSAVISVHTFADSRHAPRCGARYGVLRAAGPLDVAGLCQPRRVLISAKSWIYEKADLIDRLDLIYGSAVKACAGACADM